MLARLRAKADDTETPLKPVQGSSPLSRIRSLNWRFSVGYRAFVGSVGRGTLWTGSPGHGHLKPIFLRREGRAPIAREEITVDGERVRVGPWPAKARSAHRRGQFPSEHGALVASLFESDWTAEDSPPAALSWRPSPRSTSCRLSSTSSRRHHLARAEHVRETVVRGR